MILDNISKAAAVLGALIAVGQAGTSWINGHWQAKSEQAKAEQELKLAQLKDKSALAESYIKLIISKDTSEQDRVMLLGALSQLTDHPLQAWALARYQAIQTSIDRLNAAYLAQSQARELKTEDARKEAALVSEINGLNAEIELSRENVLKTKELSKQRIVKSEELLLVRARLAVASVRLDGSTAVIARAQAGSSITANIVDRADAITDLAQQIDAKLLMSIFPESSKGNVEKNVRFLAAALQESKISDPRVAAIIIATIFVETPAFDAYEESQSRFNTKKEPFDLYEGRKDLGNNQPGDGARFRGRGFLGLTGRANYTKMSQRLGLGSRLVDSPEDAKSPEVSARIACAYFVDRLPQLVNALDRDDLAFARRLVSGGSFGLERFIDAYRTLLSRLKTPTVPSGRTVAVEKNHSSRPPN